MVAKYTDATKLSHAKMIAKEGGCFIVERGGCDDKIFLLYRECQPRNVLVGKRSSVEGILSLTKKATNFEEAKKVSKKA
jgi:hypothetical protein